ncbi:MAG: hypothetical protein R3204_16280, partial [Oceanospirillum sp.]|nr:hypothetical protein [Oceanospirillum sp.]
VLPQIAQWQQDDQIWLGLQYDLNSNKVRFNVNIHDEAFDKTQLDTLVLKLDGTPVFTFDSSTLGEFDNWANHEFDFVGNEGAVLTLEHDAVQVGELTLPSLQPSSVTISAADIVVSEGLITVTPTLSDTTGSEFDLAVDVAVMLANGDERYFWLSTHENEANWDGSILSVDLTTALERDGIDPTTVSNVVVKRVIVESELDGLLLESVLDLNPNTNPDTGTGGGDFFDSLAQIDVTVSGADVNSPVLNLAGVPTDASSIFAYVAESPLNLLSHNNEVAAQLYTVDAPVSSMDLTTLLSEIGAVMPVGDTPELTGFVDSLFEAHLFAAPVTAAEVQTEAQTFIDTHGDLNETFVENLGVTAGAEVQFSTGTATLPAIA